MRKVLPNELCRQLQAKTGASRDQLNTFIDAFFSIIQEGLNRDGQVKIKGLGTFKVVAVEARESVNVNTGERLVIDEHNKITFTPDNTMKELVNRPFSQFDTVVLNEGVTFDDDMLDEPMPIAETPDSVEVSQPAPAETAADTVETTEPTPLMAEAETVQPTPLMAEAETVQPTPLMTEVETAQPADEKPIEPVADEPQPVAEEPQSVAIVTDAQADEQPPKRLNRRTWAVAALLAGVVCGLVYYLYGGNDNVPKVMLQAESIDTVKTPDAPKTESPSTGEKKQSSKLSGTKADAKPDSTTVTAAPQKYGPLTQEEKERVKKEASKYENKDPRVRTGAYYIRGLDFEESARQGDNLKRIARRTIGEELVCYLAVYNNLRETDTLRTGQKIRIPKLVTKKRVHK